VARRVFSWARAGRRPVVAGPPGDSRRR